MTEMEWLACSDPTNMLEYFWDKTSDRKFRLFAIGCCWQLMPWNTNKRVLKALARAERYAEGELSDSTMDRWCRELWHVQPGHDKAQNTLIWAVSSVCLSRQYHVKLINGWQALTNAPGLYGPTNISGAFGPEFSAKAPALLRRLFDDVFGNPFRPTIIAPRWLTSNVVDLAKAIYEERAFDRLPILADALMDAGCDNEEVLGHCRSSEPHVRGCWVVDLVLGKM